MPATTRKDHIIVHSRPQSEDFRPRNAGSSEKEYSIPENRVSHGKTLIQAYEKALEEQRDHTDDGFRMLFSSQPDEDMPLQSLERAGAGQVQLLSSYFTVSGTEKDAQKTLHANVYIPSNRKDYIGKKLRSYVQTALDESNNKPANANLVDRIASIRSARARDLWTDVFSEFPSNEDQKYWWEVWLINAKRDTVERFEKFVDQNGLQTSGHYLGFADRSVILVEATAQQLDQASSLLGILAELRKPHDTAEFIENLEPKEQKEWADDVLSRVMPASNNAPTVCILDKGVQREHPLLRDSLDANDVLSAYSDSNDLNWNPSPPRYAQGEDAHGTEMAGLALYGDLGKIVQSSGPIPLNHRLESVRILPVRGQNKPAHYADITASAASVVEQHTQSNHRRTYMMAVTSSEHEEPDYSAGQPTSWSSAIDALSFGQSIQYADNDEHFAVLSREPKERHPRLFVISAGNLNIMRDDYQTDDPHSESDTEPVGDPAQSWNALTVGAYANDDRIPIRRDDCYKGYSPLSPSGDLLATSRTSVMFDRNKWPIKPDVVASGGNYVAQPGGTPDFIPELGILTTRFFSAGNGLFTVTKDTSAATAQVAAIAAQIQAKYPKLRPETVRALIVHSAEWTDEMRKQFDEDSETCLRRYGMGIPDIERALYSASNATTLVAESVIHPYRKSSNGTNYISREMNIHQLPWPKTALEALGNQQVQLRLTLSYFIEPNPSRRGWNGRYTYPSFGLRFALQRRNETMYQFRRRLNENVERRGMESIAERDSAHFILSDRQEREPGSIRSCIWEGPAIDIAQTNAVAIMPTNGWWKERPQFDQSNVGVHYSLIMSLRTASTDVDLWTEINNANVIATPTISTAW